MPRRGGEADKLGNRYEGLWTVENLLDVLSGKADSITIEPFGDDASGIEFIKTTSTGQLEFHSAKRQTTGEEWSISKMVAGGSKSILGLLYRKLDAHPNSRVIFVSGTTANQLDELSEQAGRLKTVEHFLPLLEEAQWRKKRWDLLLPLCHGKPEIAFDYSSIARLLFHDPARWPKLEGPVKALVKDKIIAVRAAAQDCTLAVLNIDRNLAIQLFTESVTGAEEILATRTADNFLHHAVYSHYALVRKILLKMLKSPAKEARASAARQIAVASFHDVLAKEDLPKALAGDGDCREAVAGVYAHNLGNEPLRAECRSKLMSLFNDESSKVRKTAGSCFRYLTSEQITEESDLIFAFIESKSFDGGLDTLIWTLKDATSVLPDVVCAIPEKVVAKHLAEHPNEFIDQYTNVYGIPELVVRLYDQTPDEKTKTRCLDCIDAMLEIGFGNLESELEKIER